MTRETKLGVGIAGLFLTVVGTGVGWKWYRGDTPAVESNETAAVAADTSNPDPPSGAGAKQEAAPPPPAALMSLTTELSTPPITTAIPTSLPVMTPAIETKTEDPPPPSMPVMTQPVVEQPKATVIDKSPVTTSAVADFPVGTTIVAPLVDPPPTPVQAPVALPSPPPVMETKKDPEPPPTAVIITKPMDQTTPTVTVTPASAGSTATLGPPGGPPPAFAGAATPAAARPTTEPRVQSYIEEQHHWQPGDSFAGVAQKHYFSDKYAAALQQYNREYPLAGPGMRQNPPAMTPGQVIWIPPVRILERDHATLIADLRPLNERGSPVRPADSVGGSSAFGSPKLSKVRERGESMYEIAKRTLNDSGQWYQIHRLNPTLSRDPKLPIPAGTVLRLPPEARVEAADAP